MNQSEEKELKKAWEINAELMAGLEVGAGKYKQLRELNAELAAALKDVLSNSIIHPESFQKAAALIAKAEALK